MSAPGDYKFLVSVWLNPDDRSQLMLSLYQIEVARFAQKGVNYAEASEVNGNSAFWIEGEHVFRLADGRFQSWLFVEGNVLLWWDGNVTYRLEGATSLAEAIRIAESLQPIE